MKGEFTLEGRSRGLFSENVTLLREKAGLSKQQLAAFIGVHPSTVSRWESNNPTFRFPEPQHLDQLADYFQVSIGDFFRPHGTAGRALDFSLDIGTALMIVNNHMKDLIIIRKKEMPP